MQITKNLSKQYTFPGYLLLNVTLCSGLTIHPKSPFPSKMSWVSHLFKLLTPCHSPCPNHSIETVYAFFKQQQCTPYHEYMFLFKIYMEVSINA